MNKNSLDFFGYQLNREKQHLHTLEQRLQQLDQRLDFQLRLLELRNKLQSIKYLLKATH